MPRDIFTASEMQLITDAARDATIVWDFDGTIVDNESLAEESYLIQLRAHGHEPPADFFDRVMGRTEQQIWETLSAEGAPVTSVEEMAAEHLAYKLALTKERLRPSWIPLTLMPIFSGIAERQVVLSNGSSELNGALLEHWGLNHHVENLRVPPGRSKASLLPELLDERAVSIEDNAGYLNLARDAGAFCIGVRHAKSSADMMRAHVTVRH